MSCNSRNSCTSKAICDNTRRKTIQIGLVNITHHFCLFFDYKIVAVIIYVIAYEAKQKELQNVLANSLKTPTAENARLYEGLVQELESLKKKIETEELERSKTLMSKTRTLEFEQFITSSKLFHEFDEMVFRKLVEKVVICEDSVVFKFTDYLEREVPLID